MATTLLARYPGSDSVGTSVRDKREPRTQSVASAVSILTQALVKVPIKGAHTYLHVYTVYINMVFGGGALIPRHHGALSLACLNYANRIDKIDLRAYLAKNTKTHTHRDTPPRTNCTVSGNATRVGVLWWYIRYVCGGGWGGGRHYRATRHGTATCGA